MFRKEMNVQPQDLEAAKILADLTPREIEALFYHNAAALFDGEIR